MRQRRQRGGANSSRALYLASLGLDSAGQSNLQITRQDNEEVKGIRRRRIQKSRQGVKPANETQTNPSPLQDKRGKRNFRFSNSENMTLVSTLVPMYEQLLGKYKSATPVLRKSQMWQEICNAVNSVGNKQRLIRHCKNRFNWIKRRLKNKLNQEKNHTGKSAFHVHYTRYEEKLKKVLPAEVIDGIEFFDSEQPQVVRLEETAGPSWRTPQTGQKLQKPEALQGQLCISLLDDSWSFLPDPSSTFSERSSAVRSMDVSTDHLGLQPRRPVDQTRPELRSAGYSTVQPSPRTVPTPSLCDEPLLKILQTTQRMFRKGMTHSLNVLRSDLVHANKGIDGYNSIADKLLEVENRRNSILHQMNVRLDKLGQSVEELVNQQKAEHILLHDSPQRQSLGAPSLYPSLKKQETAGGHRQAGKVKRSAP